MKKTTSIASLVALIGSAAFIYGTSSEDSRLVNLDFSFSSNVADNASVTSDAVTTSVDSQVRLAVEATDMVLDTAVVADPSSQLVAQQSAAPTANNQSDLDKEIADQEQAITAARAKMSGPVAAMALVGGATTVDLVVSYDDYPELFEAERVEELGGVVVRTFETLQMMAIRIPAGTLDEFALDNNVDRLSIDEPISATSLSSRQTATCLQRTLEIRLTAARALALQFWTPASLNTETSATTFDSTTS